MENSSNEINNLIELEIVILPNTTKDTAFNKYLGFASYKWISNMSKVFYRGSYLSFGVPGKTRLEVLEGLNRWAVRTEQEVIPKLIADRSKENKETD